MDPDFDITLNSAEGPSGDLAKGQFLNSLGLDERHLLGSLGGDRGEVGRDEGVVLSSTPDDLGFSSPGAAPDRRVTRFSDFLPNERETIQAITLPAEEGPRPDPEEGKPQECLIVPVDEEENLSLHCPECRGSLVLKRRHLGVEGACVWCHTPIVAAASGRDGQVRVYPILGRSPVAPQQDESAKEDSMASIGEALSEPLSKTSAKVEAPAALPALEAASEPAASFAGFGTLPTAASTPGLPENRNNGFTPSGFFPASEQHEENPAATDDIPDQAVITPDLESLYETGGFLAAAGTSPASSGFGAPLSTSASVKSDSETPEPGFGSFLQNTSGGPTPSAIGSAPPATDNLREGGFFTPTPWGPPTPTAKPTATPASSHTENSSALEALTGTSADEAPASLPGGFATGFSSPIPVTNPSVEAVTTSSTTDAPTWEAAFGTLKEAAPSPGSSAPGAAIKEITGFAMGFGDAASAPALSPSDADRPSPPPAIDSGFTIQPSTAAKVQEEAKSLEESRSFAPPFQAFATGSSIDGESTPRNLFGDPPAAGSMWGGGNAADEAPTPFSPLTPLSDHGSAPRVEAEPLFTAETNETTVSLPSAPASGSTSMFADFRVADPDEPNPAPAAEPAPVNGPPALPSPAADGSAAAMAASPGVMPQVTSQPLGAKPKPKVRKGFIVLMVVIVGFASGAALASFVLPVEQYVNAARAFMEAKFGGGSGLAVPQMPAMPDGMSLQGESPATEATTQP